MPLSRTGFASYEEDKVGEGWDESRVSQSESTVRRKCFAFGELKRGASDLRLSRHFLLQARLSPQ